MASDPILNTIWMDSDNCFWDASKRSYLKADTRAMAQEAKAAAFKNPNGVLASHSKPASLPSATTLLRILHAPAKKQTAPVISRSPSRSESQFSSSVESFCFTTRMSYASSQTSCASDCDTPAKTIAQNRDERRRSLVLSLVEDGSISNREARKERAVDVHIRAPQPRRFCRIPFLQSADRSAAQTNNSPSLHANALNLTLHPGYTTHQQLRGISYAATDDEEDVQPRYSAPFALASPHWYDDGFEGDDEFDDDESDMDDEDVQGTPRKDDLGVLPGAPVMRAIPLPPLSPSPRCDAASVPSSAVTFLDYPDQEAWLAEDVREPMLSPVGLFMTWQA